MPCFVVIESSSLVVNERCSEGTLTGCRLDIPSVKRGDTFDPQASREFSIRELSARFVERTFGLQSLYCILSGWMCHR